MGRSKRLLIFLWIGNLRRAGTQNPMSIRLLASFGSPELHRHNLIAQYRHQPAYWTNKALRLARTPIHTLWPIDRGNLLGHCLGQDLRSLPPFARHARRQILAFGISDSL